MRKTFKRMVAFSVAFAQVAALGVAVPGVASAATSPITRNMENLDRGVVAMKVANGTYISWRRLATEPENTVFQLYRNQELVTEGAITNFSDPNGNLGDSYTVVCNGKMSDPAPVWADNYIEIPLRKTPESETMHMDRNGLYYGSYTPGDGSYADLDGDGEYEILMLWNPPDAKDAASGGRTGKVYLDAYKLDGTFMWTIDMGYNIRAGAHDTMICAADFDNDGAAEVMLRTADGTVDGVGNVIGDASKGETYENSWAALNGGKNLQGPLYVTCFDGETGAAIDTVDYHPQNTVGSMETSLSFGDDFGNRSERYNATIAWLDGVTPSVVFARGYYGGKNGRQRQAAAAYGLKGGKLVQHWAFDTEGNADAYQYVMNGNHNIEAADMDGDGKDEVSNGPLVWDDDGSVLWCSNMLHGDAMHISDFTPENEGLEVVTVRECSGIQVGEGTFAYQMGIQDAIGVKDSSVTVFNWGISMQDAKTGKFLQAYQGTKDTGRGIAANIGYGDSYYVMWGAGGTGYHDDKGTNLGDLGLSMNGRIYWDGDLQSELQDHKGAGKEIRISKYNDTTKKGEDLFVPADTHSINSTKGNMNGQGDMLGDWREEFVTYVIKSQEEESNKTTIKGNFDKDVEVEIKKTTYQYALRVYTTNIPTKYNFYTLAHDGVYRNSSGAYNNCYNQPPHVSWYMNDKIANSPYTTQPAANVKLVPNKYSAPAFSASALPAAGAVVTPTAPTTPAVNAVKVKLNGSALAFDVAPQIINDRTMVPMRKIFESMGATVNWDDATRTVTSTKGATTISMTIDNPTMTVNGNAVVLDTAPQIVNDRTLVPVRAIAESFGSTVDWDGNTKTVSITDTTVSETPAAPVATVAPSVPAVAFTGYEFAPDVPDYAVQTGAVVYSLNVTGSNVLEGVYKFDLTSYLAYTQLLTDLGYARTVSGKVSTFTGSTATVYVTEGDNTVTVKVVK